MSTFAHDRRGDRTMLAIDALVRDVRFALRMLRRSPGFAATVILISAVGIGGVAVMFSVLWGVALRPLPFGDPDRLVWAQATTAAGRPNSLSGMDYFDYRDQCNAFESLAARSVWQPGRVVTGKGEPERVPSIKVSKNFFHTLGIPPFLGRSFAAAEEVAGGPNVVVVSYGFWQRKLSARPDIIGTPISIDDAAYTIVGVMPDNFDYPAEVELWFPMQRGGGEESGRGNNNFLMIGRLAEGATLARAQSQMEVVAARISAAFPREKGGWSVRLTPLDEQFFGPVRPAMFILMGATALVLLIVCANLSSLLLARILSRRGELAVRLSLGASAMAVTRQLLMESLVLVTAGAAVGVGLAGFGIRAVKALGPGDLPRLDSIGLDAHVLWVATAAAVLTALLAGVAPALQGTRLDLLSNLRESGRTTEGRGHLRSRRLLVATQLALSLVLLVVTGLLLRSMMRLQQVDPGLEAEGLLTVDVQIPGPDTERQSQRYFHVLERIRALPGVVSAAGADQLPFFGGPWNGVHRADRPPRTSSDFLPATRRMVTEGFFGTMGIPLLAGRTFSPSDRRDSPRVTVVSRSLAEQLFPNENPVGRILVLPWGPGIPLEIIGVAGDVRDFGLASDFRPAFYLTFRQVPGAPESLRLVIRSKGRPAALVSSVRQAIREMEQDAPLYRVSSMDKWVSDSTTRQRFSSFLLGTFAGVATLLAAVGLFGLMSYVVAQRRHEIGIRLALGAPAGSVRNLIFRQGFALALAGTVVGIPCALAAARMLGTQLYAISPTDGLTFAVAPLVLIAAALAASLAPALHATRINCVEALKAE
jgi:putative ABC transport system permease protein